MKFMSTLCFSLVLLLGSGASVNAQSYKWQDLWNLAYKLYQTGKYDDGAMVAANAVDAAETEFGARSGKVANSLCLLGLCYSQQGKYKVSEELYKIALPIYEEVNGPDSADAKAVRMSIATVQQYQQGKSNFSKDDKPPTDGGMGWGYRRGPNGTWIANSAGDYRNTVIQENNPAQDRRNAAGGSQDAHSRKTQKSYAPINSVGNDSDLYQVQNAAQSARENEPQVQQAEQQARTQRQEAERRTRESEQQAQQAEQKASTQRQEAESRARERESERSSLSQKASRLERDIDSASFSRSQGDLGRLSSKANSLSKEASMQGYMNAASKFRNAATELDRQDFQDRSPSQTSDSFGVNRAKESISSGRSRLNSFDNTSFGK